jgi:hypothetical protein
MSRRHLKTFQTVDGSGREYEVEVWNNIRLMADGEEGHGITSMNLTDCREVNPIGKGRYWVVSADHNGPVLTSEACATN